MAKTLAREKCTSADYDNAHVQCDKTASIFLVGNLIFFFRMQTEVYKPTEEGKSFIYCGERVRKTRSSVELRALSDVRHTILNPQISLKSAREVLQSEVHGEGNQGRSTDQ